MVYKVGERHVWAPHRVWWLIFAVLGLGAVVFTLGVGIRDAVHRPGGASSVFYAWLVASLIWCAFLYRALLWPRLTADKEGLTICNPVKTHRIPWREIRSIEIRSGRQPVRVITRDDSIVVIRALAVAITEGGSEIGLDRTQEVVRFLEGWRQTELPMSSPE